MLQNVEIAVLTKDLTKDNSDHQCFVQIRPIKNHVKNIIWFDYECKQEKGEVDYIKTHRGYKGQNNFNEKKPKDFIHVPVLIGAKWNNGEKCRDCSSKPNCQDWVTFQKNNATEFQM